MPFSTFLVKPFFLAFHSLLSIILDNLDNRTCIDVKMITSCKKICISHCEKINGAVGFGNVCMSHKSVRCLCNVLRW